MKSFRQYTLVVLSRDEDPVSGSGALGLTFQRYSKYNWISFLDNLQVLFFVFLIFCVRRSIDALDPENQPGSGSVKIRTGSGSRALRLTENVWHQKYENKKEGLQNYLEFSFNSILNISYRSGYRALDPKFCQNRILIPDFTVLEATKTSLIPP